MPRPADRIKIRRKDLRGPDEFTTLTTHATEWLAAHQGLVIALAATVVAVAIGAIVAARWRTSQRDAAATAFRAAYQTFEAGKYAEAAPSFAAVAEEYPKTPFGGLARLYRAHALGRKPDADAAATAYQEYLDSGPASAYLQQEALVGLAHAKEAGGDAGDALEAYVKATELDGPYRVEAMLGAARLDEAAGRPDAARGVYAQAAKATTDPELRALLEEKAAGAMAKGEEREGPAGAGAPAASTAGEPPPGAAER